MESRRASRKRRKTKKMKLKERKDDGNEVSPPLLLIPHGMHTH